MAAIRNKNTAPEMIVRRALHVNGIRYRLHRKDLPGRPDIVMPKHNAVVFVHGCFWHIHRCPYGKPKPVTNADFWTEKRQGNVERDRRNRKALKAAGWRVFTVWECETRDPQKLADAISRILHELNSGAL